MVANNVPYCLSASCNEDTLKSYQADAERIINELFDALSMDCTVVAEPASGAATQMTGFALIGAAALAFFF